jgi:cyclophilin family peptidyl-prolyl cis-trans isomerase
MNKVYILLVIIILGFCFWIFKTPKTKPVVPDNQPKKETTVSKYSFPGVLADAKIKNKKAVVKTSKGVIEFNLDADQSPKTVSNFVYLSELGYYNGLTFHRVVPHFVIQGGDPTGTGSGGPGYQFEDEKVTTDYKAGTVAMANSGANTNGSQFFICLEDQPSLPKLYTIFGQVTVGQDVVGKIQVGDKIDSVTIANQ